VKKGYQWFVAWRYLMARPRKISSGIAVTVGLLAVGLVGCLVLAYGVYDEVSLVRGVEVENPMRERMMWAAIGCGALLELTLLMGIVRYAFTFFTSVSIGGVAIGSMALVIVLSVMSGFETDLRDKILGSNAHLRVTKVKGELADYDGVIAQVVDIPDVVAASPYLTSEVVIGASSTYANVIIKGVEPRTVGDVTDLVENLEEEGSLERMWPLNEDGTVRGPPDDGGSAKPSDPAGTDPAGTPGADPGGRDPAPDDMDVPDDDEPIDFSADEQDGEQELEDEWAALEGWPEDFSGTAFAGTRRQSSASARVNLLDGVLVGRELVKNLHLYVGQEVSLVSPLGQMTPAGPVPRSKPYRIGGSFFTGMYEYDTKFIYVDFRSLQRFLSLGDEVNGIEVRVKDRDDTEGVKAAIRKRLGPDYEVKDWKEINRNLFSALELEKIAMFLVLAIIILVASFSIIGNLIMVVVEKAKEIALLKTLGSSNQGVMKIFVVQGFFIGLVGTTIGVANGLIACWLGKTWGLPLDPDVYYIDRLPITVEWPSVAAIAAAGVFISVLATLYPAYMGAQVEPVEGLRYE
jgi:lipoprotein-releasing system permease protein